MPSTKLGWLGIPNRIEPSDSKSNVKIESQLNNDSDSVDYLKFWRNIDFDQKDKF